MKKLITLLLILTGMVSTASATDYSIGANEGSWGIKGQMTSNGDGSYSYIINLPANYDNYLFTIFEGTEIADGWSNAYRPSGAGNNWGLGDNNTPTMVKGGNDYVLSYPVSSTIARAIKVDFTPSTGACIVTRLIAVASGYNGWSTETDYLAETSRASNIYTGKATLEINSEGYDDGFQFVGINSGKLTYYSYKNENGNEWIDVNQSNAIVAADGVYDLTANFSNYKWVAPELVTVTPTISSVGYATFSSEYALDFTNSSVKAYRATSIENGRVMMTKVTGKVKANTGLFLAGTAEAINTTIYDTEETNLLHPTDGNDIFVGGTPRYVFANQDGLGFYKVVYSLSPAAGKAYLETEETIGAGARLGFALDDEEVTGISQIENGVLKVENYFNLAGQRVARPTKGLYIVNGKKYIVK